MIKRLLHGILIISVLALFLCGCGGKAENNTSDDVSVINLYYRSVDSNEFIAVPYELKSEYSLGSAQEVMKKLFNRSQKVEDGYSSPAPDDLMINDIKFEKNQIYIDFNEVYRDMTATGEMFFRSCVVLSLSQIKGINSIDFRINGEELMDSSGNIIGPMHARDFVIEDVNGSIYTYNREVKLYYAAKDEKHLVAVEKEITNEIGDPMEKAALLALAKEADDEESYMAPLPEKIRINSLTLNGGTWYVDLSDDILTPVSGVTSKMAVYAMANTLIDMSGASNVSFTVNGASIENLNDFEGFNSLIGFDYQIVLENN